MSTAKKLTPMPNVMDDFEDDDRKLQEYAQRVGIPTLEHSAAEAKPKPEHGVPKRSKSKRNAERKAPAKVWFEMPAYAVQSLKRRAFEQGCTVRSLMLRALHESKIVEIDPEDLVADRRSHKTT